MLAEQRAVGTEEQSGAVKGAAVAFDDADDQEELVRTSDPSHCLAGWAGNSDGTVEVAAELLATFGGAAAQPGSEAQALGIAGDKRLGQHGQPRAAAGCLGDAITEPGQGLLDVEDDRCGLDD